MKIRVITVIVITLITVINFVIFAYPALGFLRSSENFRIQADSLNVGGAREFSTNFRMEDTTGEIASDESQSASFKLRAGYQQMLETFISISDAPNVTMSQTIPGIGGGFATGDAVWTVTTDNRAGYTLTVKASTDPALLCDDGAGGCVDGVDVFANYTPEQAGTPDFTFSIGVNTAEFGFTPEGADVTQKFLDNGSICNTGSSNTADACWYNFATADENIAKSSVSNHPSGTATTIKFRAESGTSNVQTSGIYRATITVTATAN